MSDLNESPDLDTLWWTKGHTSPAQAMVAAAQTIQAGTDYQRRLALNMATARMAEGQPLPSLYAFGGNWSAAIQSIYGEEPSIFNVARQVCMAATNQITRGAPKPKATSNGGTWEAIQRAEELTEFVLAIMRDNNADELFAKAFYLALATDVAGVQVLEEPVGKIKLQLVWSNELLWNLNEALFSEPRTWYRQRFFAKDALRRKFGKKAKPELLAAIDALTPVDFTGLGQPSTMVPVWEGWHLGDEGKHLIAIDASDVAGQLFIEDWKRPRPSIETLTWEPAFAGPYGRSLVSQLAGIQISINRQLIKIEQNLRLVATPKLWVHTSSGTNTDKLGNKPGEVISGTTAPQFILPQAVGPEVFKHLQDQIDRAYMIAGISREAAMGLKPVGLNSGRALETHLDMVEARQALAQQRYEAFVCRVAQQIIWLAEDIYKRTGKLEVRTEDALEPLSYGDVHIDEGEYVIRIDAVSGLPETPQGKMDLIDTLAKVPGFPPDRILQVYDSLDPKAELTLALASKKAIDKDLQTILRKGKYVQPEPYFGPDALAEGIQRAQAMYCTARLQKAPKKHMDKLCQWMDDASELLTQLRPPPAPPAAVAPGLPVAPAPLAGTPAPAEAPTALPPVAMAS